AGGSIPPALGPLRIPRSDAAALERGVSGRDRASGGARAVARARSRDAHSRADHRRGASAGRGHRRGPRARPARDAQLMTTIDPLPRPQVVGVFSPGIARIPHLRAFLGAERIVLRPTALSRVDCVVGWGRKANTA